MSMTQTRVESDSIGKKKFQMTRITMSVEAGQLELNAFEPVVFQCLFESITMLKNAVDTFVTNCIDGITANEERCHELLDSSVGMVTALCPHIGYAKAAELAKQVLTKRGPVRTLLLEQNIMMAEELDTVLDAHGMTPPGISGKELLKA